MDALRARALNRAPLLYAFEYTAWVSKAGIAAAFDMLGGEPGRTCI